MIKCLYILFSLFFPMIMVAQSATEEALDKACNCFNGVDFDGLIYDKVATTADSCISDALYTNLTGVLKENKASLEDSDAMFQVAQILHQHLLKHCVGFQQFSKRVANQKLEVVKEKTASSIGLLYTLNTNQQFPIITIITEDEEALEFIWFREFDGSTRFMKGIKAYENTVVEIFWKDVELYDVVSQQYPFYKEIVLIEELRTLEKKEQKAWVKAYQKSLKKREREGRDKK